ncbi:FtsK/SpoIIIE family DNA translocase [Pelolinea submarina]|uniref:S-DNA-T family DNA segregation ATPase FtsK/SpoIIIE n=1 Tax=Pelolinea submarina TaxID=913107 RepID=A0A347ZSA9_9CHLR|nr:DNA translocase FtsK [Pelolinea submarina]REG11244.1 S-DNA-T family DNA segregation ATPase FtsK/SpoIIIE [Pelolinea submarina]BBB48190.1 DNA segregation ATPase FtsK/SpoIIIE, S-DNA-T family [Pelolinea submarina]
MVNTRKPQPPEKKNIGNVLAQTIKRFGQDVVGILIVSTAIITALNILGLTSGTVANLWTDWIVNGFGWGTYILVALVIYIGLLILFRRIEQFPRLNLKRIISLELSLFSMLALFSAFFGFSVDRAHLGLDGGVIGWGLASIFKGFLGNVLATALLLVVWLLTTLAGIGFLLPLSRKLDRYFNRVLQTTVNNDFSQDSSVESDLEEKQPAPTEGTYPQTATPAAAAPTRQLALPPMDLLLDAQTSTSDEPFIHAKAIQIEKTLEEFGIPARVAGYRVGPTIIQYAVEPGYVEKVNEEGDIVRKKVRVSQISGLSRDLTLALGVDRLRIEAPIPGHSFVGIEIPNTSSSLVRLKTILNSVEFKAKPAPLNLALGLNVSGAPVIADLTRMPHVLVAGTTGSGKSVCITSLIACLVMNNTPDDLRIAILDPKMVELLRFNGLPHLMGKVETQLDRMLGVLAWAIKEMDDRYKKLEAVNARDLEAYNAKMARRGGEHLPKIVIFIDELADLMLSAPDSTEGYLVRLAQMARATGIHLVVATQRPSTNIITGLIKANFPARISFMMASSVDSRVILDANGAETLMGRGDMLFLDPETAGLKRAQAVLVDDREIENIIAYWKNATQTETPAEEPAPWEGLVPSMGDDADDLIEEAIKLVRQEGHTSTSRLQRKLRIGFPRAARLMDELEERGIVGPVESGGREREVLFDDPPDEPEAY